MSLKIVAMKYQNIMFVALLGAVLLFSSCEKDCEKDNRSTFRLINETGTLVDVRLSEPNFDGQEFRLSRGETKDVFVYVGFSDDVGRDWDSGYQTQISYDVQGDGEEWLSLPVIITGPCDLLEVTLQ